jgi:hypothetical protein
MRKVWALIEIGDTVMGGVFNTQEEAQNAKENLSYFGDMLEVREIELNEEPLDEEGEELKLRLKELLKDTVHFHMSKGPKFYELSLKERYRFLINTLTTKGEEVDFGAPESGVEQVDVRDFVKKL